MKTREVYTCENCGIENFRSESDCMEHEEQCLKKDRTAILVWQFRDAPARYRDQSTHGGDEDWLAVVPPYLKDEWISWLESGGRFGCCSVSKQPQPDGSILYIGAHA